MKQSRPIISILAAAILAVCAGCSSGPRLDTTTPASLEHGLDRFINEATAKQRPARIRAANILKAAYLSGDTFRKQLAKGVPPIDILTKARFEDILTIAGRIERWQTHGMQVIQDPPIAESATERRWRNQFLLDQLKAQASILESARDFARYKDLFTIDQFRYLDSAFIPPQDGLPLGEDYAKFTTSFKNQSVFSVYSVGFHIVVKDPSMALPIIDDVFTYSADKTPIEVGETRQIELTCCDGYRNPVVNQQLRNLAPDASIDMDLVKVTDYSKADRLKDINFTSADNLKLLASQQCAADIAARLQNWTPETADPSCSSY